MSVVRVLRLGRLLWHLRNLLLRRSLIVKNWVSGSFMGVNLTCSSLLSQSCKRGWTVRSTGPWLVKSSGERIVRACGHGFKSVYGRLGACSPRVVAPGLKEVVILLLLRLLHAKNVASIRIVAERSLLLLQRLRGLEEIVVLLWLLELGLVESSRLLLDSIAIRKTRGLRLESGGLRVDVVQHSSVHGLLSV